MTQTEPRTSPGNTHQQTGKIPCSVGLLTLNSEEGLERCLESLKDFAEIIVCDGNSTDRTREIAEAYGAVIVRQYDSDEPDLPCVKDKAGARERSMRPATQDWFFFMDADDTLSPEAVEEVRAIVTNPAPAHRVWRMPTRIFIDGQEILHEATYPSYQTRLAHRSVGARFKGEVHDRFDFDEKQFPVGTMRSYYNFHWSQERYRGFWTYLKRYADWEVETYQPRDLRDFLYWNVYRRVRTILGYVLWRLPKMYLRWGTRGTMPVRIELTIVRYHLRILRRTAARYLSTRSSVTIILETLRGKDINRTLSNMALRKVEAFGKILDIGGGEGTSSHYRFLRITKWVRITKLDVNPHARPDILIDLEKEPLPVPNAPYDHVFAFNVLERLSARSRVLAEVQSVLKDGGTFVGSIPFLVNVHPDPADYVRLTRQGLEAAFKDAGFSSWDIRAIGTGPFLAGYYQVEFLMPRIVRLLFLPLVFALDALARRARPKLALREKFPLTYTFVAHK